MNKYRNVKVTIDGLNFDSKGEASRWFELVMLQMAGKISELKRQVPFILLDSFKDSDGKTVRAVKIVVDFGYVENGQAVVEDFKSPASRTRAFLLKKKMFQAKFPEIVFRESSR